jgi:hypothetical protein
VLVGICDCLRQHLARGDYGELRQAAFSCCFDILFHSRMLEMPAWSRFVHLSLGWSGEVDFLKVWNRQVTAAFSWRLSMVDKVQAGAPPLQGGVYTEEPPVTVKTVEFLFQNSLSMIDLAAVKKQPDSLHELYATVANMVKITETICRARSGVCLSKFPAASFLKLFGGYITCAPCPSEPFEQSLGMWESSSLSSRLLRGRGLRRISKSCAVSLSLRLRLRDRWSSRASSDAQPICSRSTRHSYPLWRWRPSDPSRSSTWTSSCRISTSTPRSPRPPQACW